MDEITLEEYQRLWAEKKPSKFKNETTTVDGITFPSKAEARTYRELKLQEQAGEIHGLTLQPVFELQPAFRDRHGTHHRAITYRSDFQYTVTATRQVVVAERKGYETEAWKIKRKLFQYRYPEIELRIIKGR